MKIAVFGANGQAGSACVSSLLQTGYDVLPLTRQQFDFAHPEILASSLATEFDCGVGLVINTCAYTAVDKAESECELADTVNHLSVAILARYCESKGIPLLHLSTDYVFDGCSSAPYAEDAPVNPINVYGATKLAGEQAIAREMTQYIILRTSWVFGESGYNFVKTMLRIAEKNDTIKVVGDQFGRPSYVGDIVSVLLYFVSLYERDACFPVGIYHCANPDKTSWYDFACSIFELAVEHRVIALAPTVLKVGSDQYPTAARRPASSVLDTQKLDALRGECLPHWRDGLSRFFLSSTSSHANNIQD